MTTSPLANKSYKPTPTSQKKEKTYFVQIHRRFAYPPPSKKKAGCRPKKSSHQPFIQDAHEKPLRCGKSCPSFRLASKRPAPLLTAKAKAWMANFQCHRSLPKNMSPKSHCKQRENVVFELQISISTKDNEMFDHFVLFDFPVVY